MVLFNAASALGVDGESDGVAHFDRGLGNLMCHSLADFLYRADLDGIAKLTILEWGEDAGVAELATHFYVEWGTVGDHEESTIAFVDFEHLGFAGVFVVAGEFGDHIGRNFQCADDGFLL